MLEFKPVLNVTVIVPMMDVDAIVPVSCVNLLAA